MIQIVLHHPEIPQNTGSIARLCAATDTPLNLIEPLGFSLADRYLKRAGLDYWPHVKLAVWSDWRAFLEGAKPGRLVFTSSGNRGVVGRSYHQFPFSTDDALVFGSESSGLPDEMLGDRSHLVRIPIWGCVRSLNLANAASILLYEALRATGGLPGETGADETPG
ncbi:tRNA (cytidine(34)-2'-O)-methyltransferase [Fundidesulfovibrio butyratiphilus]